MTGPQHCEIKSLGVYLRNNCTWSKGLNDFNIKNVYYMQIVVNNTLGEIATDIFTVDPSKIGK